MATEQEILDAAQARLLEKREALGATTNPIQSMRFAPSDDKFTPQCKHGNCYGECPECEAGWKVEEEKRKREELERKQSQKAAELKMRAENPWQWLSEYGVPPKYKDASFENFIGGQSAKKHCLAFPDKNIVLSGKTGCGKTHLAIATLRKMVINDEIPRGGYSRDSWELPVAATFVTVPSLLMEIRDCFKAKADESEFEIVERYVSYPILILDDLGADRATEWAIETLYLIIDGRDSNLKPTFITTNLSVHEIEQHYGARIASRIAGMSILSIDLPDYRKKRRAA